MKRTESKCKRNILFLKYLNSLDSKRRRKLIAICDKKEIESIIEVFINFLHKNISCKNKFIKSVKKHSKKFNKIIKKIHQFLIKENFYQIK